MATAENGSQAVVAVGEVKSALPAPQLDVLETQTKAIGIIQPPHQIRLIIDKTAGFVAKTGACKAPCAGYPAPALHSLLRNSSALAATSQPGRHARWSCACQHAAHLRTLCVPSSGAAPRMHAQRCRMHLRFAGPEVEKKILAGEKSVKFNFINPTDPYHKYYQYKLTEAKEGPEAAQAKFKDAGASALAPAAAAQQQAAQPAEPAAPPPTQELQKPADEKYTAHIPPGLTFQELDVIKLTAQFVARNGLQFLNGLRSREENKREFMFLRETHSLNTFFKRLTDAYSSVLLDSKEALQQLHGDANDSSAILQRCARQRLLAACARASLAVSDATFTQMALTGNVQLGHTTLLFADAR